MYNCTGAQPFRIAIPSHPRTQILLATFCAGLRMPRVWPRYGDARARLAANLSPGETAREGNLSPPSSSGSVKNGTHSNPVSPASAPVGTPTSPDSSGEVSARMRRSTGQLTPLGSDAGRSRRNTPSASLPQRDPVTRKRLWPKLGGYEPIKVPASSRFLSSDSDSDEDDSKRAVPVRARTQSPPPRKAAYSPPSKTVVFDLEDASYDRAKKQDTQASGTADRKLASQSGFGEREDSDRKLERKGQEDGESREAEKKRLGAQAREDADRIRREQEDQAKDEEDRRYRERMAQADEARRQKEKETEAKERRDREARAKAEEQQLENEKIAREEAARERERQERLARERAESEARLKAEAELREEAARRQKESEAKERESREALEREKAKNAELLKRERELFEKEKAKMELENQQLQQRLREKEEAELRRREEEAALRSKEKEEAESRTNERNAETQRRQAEAAEARRKEKEAESRRREQEEAEARELKRRQTEEAEAQNAQDEADIKASEDAVIREPEQPKERPKTEPRTSTASAASAAGTPNGSAALKRENSSVKQKKKPKESAPSSSFLVGVVWILSTAGAGLFSAVGNQGVLIIFCAAMAVSMSSCALQCLSPDELSDAYCGLLLPMRRMHDGYWPLVAQWLVANTQVLITFDTGGFAYANACWTALAMTIVSVLLLGSEIQDWSAGPTALPHMVLGATQIALVMLAVVRTSPALKRLSVQDYVSSILALLVTAWMSGCAIRFLDASSLDSSWGGPSCKALKLEWMGDEALLLWVHGVAVAMQALLSFGLCAETLVVLFSLGSGLLMTVSAVLLLGDAAEREAGGSMMAHGSLAAAQGLLGLLVVGGNAASDEKRAASRGAGKGAGAMTEAVAALLAGGVAAWMTQEAVRLLSH